jgi:murein tripeptide amidase MpaA
MLKISSNFDSGAIEVVKLERADAIEVRIRRDENADPAADFRQWFHFRLQGARDELTSIRFLNAGLCSYPKGWETYQVMASYDQVNWFRVPTTYRNGVLTLRHIPERNSVYYAYFEPYSYDRHLQLLGRAERSPRVRVSDLGSTVQGRDMNLVTVQADAAGLPLGGATNKKKIWVIARQHPGETMAEWLVEGLLERLLDETDAVARLALQHADFYIVPNMNPDGSVLGNLRTNAAGANLNREWLEPSQERSPEVFAVRQKMLATGVDLFIDAHGDEGLPFNFVAGIEMLPSTTDRQRQDQAAFIAAFKIASPDFQDQHGYPPNYAGPEALKLASKWAGQQFGCLSLTLEMPFKDNANLPNEKWGWNGARSKQLGAALLQPMLEHLLVKT